MIFLAFAFVITQEFSWNELHTTASTHSHKFVDLVYEYKKHYPCDKCRYHFRREVAKMEKFLPLNKITSEKEAIIWAWMVHNAVNLRIGNPWFPLVDVLFDPF